MPEELRKAGKAMLEAQAHKDAFFKRACDSIRAFVSKTGQFRLSRIQANAGVWK